MTSTSIEYWEYVDRIRRMVLELPDEDQRQGAASASAATRSMPRSRT